MMCVFEEVSLEVVVVTIEDEDAAVPMIGAYGLQVPINARGACAFCQVKFHGRTPGGCSVLVRDAGPDPGRRPLVVHSVCPRCASTSTPDELKAWARRGYECIVGQLPDRPRPLH